MIDFSTVTRNLILSKAPITERIGDRLWMERRTPGPGYKIGDGQAIVVYNRGGPVTDYNAVIFRIPLAVKCYGIDPLRCAELGNIFFEQMQEATAQYLLRFHIDISPQIVQEPDTAWFYSLSFYTGIFRNG